MIRRPSDGKVPEDVVFIQCVGSRDPAHGVPYCSKICCMYTAKHALLYHHAVPDGKVYIFYIDIRAGGKGYEEFVERVRAEDGINYIRGKVAKLVPKDGKLQVWGVDTLIGEQVRVEVDLVVLATAVAVVYSGIDLISGETVLTLPAENGFSVDARPDEAELGSKTKIRVNGVEEVLHTSCSTPYVAGQPAPLDDPKGDPSPNLLVEAFVEKSGNDVLLTNP